MDGLLLEYHNFDVWRDNCLYYIDSFFIEGRILMKKASFLFRIFIMKRLIIIDGIMWLIGVSVPEIPAVPAREFKKKNCRVP